MDIQIKYLSEKLGNEIKKPYYATEGSAGMDLSACIDTPLVIKKGETVIVPTGIAISLPKNQYTGLVFARSGLGMKYGITMANGVGVIDSDYTGEIKCGLINLGANDYTVNPGDRIAQLVIMPVAKVNLVEVDKLTKTDRGTGGFGSTGN